jgi:predicted RNA-binding protein with RPS1 domain
MAYERIKHPSEVVKEGQQVQVKILKIDRSQDCQTRLGLKQTGGEPAIKARGDKVGGLFRRVTKIFIPFGVHRVSWRRGADPHFQNVARRVHDARSSSPMRS